MSDSTPPSEQGDMPDLDSSVFDAEHDAQQPYVARFTPGPWRVFTTRNGREVVGIGEANGGGITDCGFGLWRFGSDECRANARLIAAAPDLYAALVAAQEDLRLLRMKDTAAVYNPALRLQIDLALAKAAPLSPTASREDEGSEHR